MEEKKQIKNAAMLSDTEPAEKLDLVRARSFVSSVMRPDKRKNGTFFAFAAIAAVAIVAAVIIIRPGSDSFGTPAVLSEQSYVHASVDDVDSTLCVQTDSLIIDEKDPE